MSLEMSGARLTCCAGSCDDSAAESAVQSYETQHQSTASQKLFEEVMHFEQYLQNDIEDCLWELEAARICSYSFNQKTHISRQHYILSRRSRATPDVHYFVDHLSSFSRRRIKSVQRIVGEILCVLMDYRNGEGAVSSEELHDTIKTVEDLRTERKVCGIAKPRSHTPPDYTYDSHNRFPTSKPAYYYSQQFIRCGSVFIEQTAPTNKAWSVSIVNDERVVVTYSGSEVFSCGAHDDAIKQNYIVLKLCEGSLREFYRHLATRDEECGYIGGDLLSAHVSATEIGQAQTATLLSSDTSYVSTTDDLVKYTEQLSESIERYTDELDALRILDDSYGQETRPERELHILTCRAQCEPEVQYYIDKYYSLSEDQVQSTRHTVGRILLLLVNYRHSAESISQSKLCATSKELKELFIKHDMILSAQPRQPDTFN